MTYDIVAELMTYDIVAELDSWLERDLPGDDRGTLRRARAEIVELHGLIKAEEAIRSEERERIIRLARKHSCNETDTVDVYELIEAIREEPS
jgi:hypothetical protein